MCFIFCWSFIDVLRTTLVHHPDDVRGRRRANEARKILLYDIVGYLSDFLETVNESWEYACEKWKQLSSQQCLPENPIYQ